LVCRLEKEISFFTCASGYPQDFLSGRFRPQKCYSKAKNRLFFSGFLNQLRYLSWSDPIRRSFRIVAHPPFCGLCRWASEDNVSITPCHPSCMALAFTMSGLPPVRMHCPSLGTLNSQASPQSPSDTGLIKG
jgi:hypothetical protein